MIRRVVGIYFSPVGRTEKMTRALAAGIAAGLDSCSPENIGYEIWDLLSMNEESAALDEETVAVIGIPVYIGKIPLPAVDLLRNITPNGAMTVVTVSYGGSSCGNALYELRHVSEELGFNIIGAGAFSVRYGREHGGAELSLIPGGRSLNSIVVDSQPLKEFCDAVSAKIRRLAGCSIEGLRIPPAPVEVSGRLPVHRVSRLFPRAAAVAQEVVERLELKHKDSEWYL